MTTLALFREFHQDIPPRAIAFFDTLSDEQMRARPQPMVNSLAWLIWHMARVEDAGINRLVANRSQVLDEGNWCEQMEIPIGVTHNYGHFYEAFTVCSLMGVPFW